jgi:hypothetical protein
MTIDDIKLELKKVENQDLLNRLENCLDSAIDNGFETLEETENQEEESFCFFKSLDKHTINSISSTELYLTDKEVSEWFYNNFKI